MRETLYDIPLDGNAQRFDVPFVPKTLIFVNGSNVNVTAADENGHTVTFGANDGGAIPIWPMQHWVFTAASAATAGSAYVYFSDRRIPGSVGGLVGGGTASSVTITGALPAGSNIIGQIEIVDGANELIVDATGWIGSYLLDAAGVNKAAVNASGQLAISNTGFNVNNTPAVTNAVLTSLLLNALNQLVVDPRGAANIASGQVATSTTAATLVAARATRQSLLIRNFDATISMYYGPPTVSAANGMLLKAGESVVLNTTALVQIIAASGTPTVGYYEEYS